MQKRIYSIFIVLIILSLTACRFTGDDNRFNTKPDQSVEFIEEINNAQKLNLNYDIGVAKFSLEGTDEAIISAVANYNDDELMPKFSLTGDNEDLQFGITQKDIDINLGFNKDPECLIQNKIYSHIPVDMDFELGVGETLLNLTNINISRLKIEAGTGKLSSIIDGNYLQQIDADIKGGVGELDLELTGTFNEHFNLDIDTGVGSVDLDLTGDFKKDGYITVKGGVGEIKMKLPSNVGIKIEGEKGLSSFTVKDNGKKVDWNLEDINYTNELFGVSDNTLYINVETGIGNVDIIIE